MTRGYTPPPSLTAEDIMSLAQVRKDLWINAAKGFCVGGASAFLLHRTAVLASQKKWIPLKTLNRNTAFASVMFGSALGSFLFATSAGKNSVHNLHPIFQRGASPVAVPADDNSNSYQNALQRAKERNDDLKELERSRALRNSVKDAEGAERIELERNRIMRRASLNGAMTKGHGLNDSHGGHWVSTKDTKFQKE